MAGKTEKEPIGSRNFGRPGADRQFRRRRHFAFELCSKRHGAVDVAKNLRCAVDDHRIAADHVVHARQNYLRADRRDLRRGLDKSRSVASHEADLRDDAGPPLALEQGVGLDEIDAHRLLDEDVFASAHCGKRGLSMVDMRICDQDRVDAAIVDQQMRIGVSFRGGPLGAYALENRAAHVAKSGDFEEIGEIAERGKVNDLRDFPATDDANANGFWHADLAEL